MDTIHMTEELMDAMASLAVAESAPFPDDEEGRMFYEKSVFFARDSAYMAWLDAGGEL